MFELAVGLDVVRR